MKKKEDIENKNIYQRINAVMAEVDYIQKDQNKKVANQYKFVSHDQVTSILHPQFVKHGIAVLPTIKERKQDGNRTEILLEVKFVNIDNPTDYFVVDSLGYGIDPADKGPGKACSYAYKYALLKTFALETGDDPDQDQQVVHKPLDKDSFDWNDYLSFKKSFNGSSELFDQFAKEVCEMMKWDSETFARKSLIDKNSTVNKFNNWKKTKQEVV